MDLLMKNKLVVGSVASHDLLEGSDEVVDAGLRQRLPCTSPVARAERGEQCTATAIERRSPHLLADGCADLGPDCVAAFKLVSVAEREVLSELKRSDDRKLDYGLADRSPL